jgi:hypothetical protein
MSGRRNLIIGAIAVTLAVIGLLQVLGQVTTNTIGPVLAADINHLIIFVVVELVILYFIYTAVLLLISPNKLIYALVKYYRRVIGSKPYRQLTGVATANDGLPDLDPPRQIWSRRFLRGFGAVLLLLALSGQYLFSRFWIFS